MIEILALAHMWLIPAFPEDHPIVREVEVLELPNKCQYWVKSEYTVGDVVPAWRLKRTKEEALQTLRFDLERELKLIQERLKQTPIVVKFR